MEDLQSLFQTASAYAESLTLPQSIMLKLYGLYKISTIGKCTSQKPGILDFRGRAKRDAWYALGDLEPETAMQQYIDLVNSHSPTTHDTQPPQDFLVSVSKFSVEKEDFDDDYTLTIIDHARDGQLSKVLECISSSPLSIHTLDPERMSALHYAVDRNRPPIVRALLTAGSNPNHRDSLGQTPLHVAASLGYTDLYQLLITYGGDETIKDDDGIEAGQICEC